MLHFLLLAFVMACCTPLTNLLFTSKALQYILDSATSLQAASLMGGLVGPALGGLLADMAGLRAPFTLTGIAALAAALYGAVRLPETMGLRKRATEESEPLPEAMAARAAQAESLQVLAPACPGWLAAVVTGCIDVSEKARKGYLHHSGRRQNCCKALQCCCTSSKP